LINPHFRHIFYLVKRIQG